MAKILKGAPVAEALSIDLMVRCAYLRSKEIIPKLAILRVGEKPADIAYEKGAMKRCTKIGVDVECISLPEDASKRQVLDAIHRINQDKKIHGCLMFRPFKDKETEAEACRLLDPKKDVDCITTGALGDVFIGKEDGFAPCTAQACMEILKHYGYDIKGKRVTVVGTSLVIGKPLAVMLVNSSGTVTMCHIDTINTEEHCRNAEILVSATGVAGLIDSNYVSPEQIILDVGINKNKDGELCGDVDFEAVEPIVEGCPS